MCSFVEIGTTKNYLDLLKISAKVYVYLKYIHDILKNGMAILYQKQRSDVHELADTSS